MNRGFLVGRLRGIEIVLDRSVLVVFFLVAFTLGVGVFPVWHPNWGVVLAWLVAIAAAVLFVASLLAHELSHVLVGRLLGLKIRRITLFVFGSMARLEGEPQAWRTEVWMAIVGPLVCLLVGFACVLGAATLAVNAGLLGDDPVASLMALDPLATIGLWLGPLSIALAFFNLLPGFPLDGGRLLRAVLWRSTGDIYRATRWASTVGRACGLLLIAAGSAMFLGVPVPYLGRWMMGGLWLVLIGGFLERAAFHSYRQLLTQRSLADMPVSRLMLADVATVNPDMLVSAFIDDCLIAHEQSSFPVLEGGRLVGLAGFEQARKLPPDARFGRTVGEIMTPARELAVVEPGAAVADALNTISRQAADPLPVVADGQVRGILRREDILKWLALRGEEEAIA